MVILTLLILGLKYCGKLPRYFIGDKDVLSHWIWPNVIKLFTAIIYCHSMVFTVIIIMFYNTEWRYDHGMAVNYCGKRFYNIGPCGSTGLRHFFATFIYWWVMKLIITQQPLSKNKHRFGILRTLGIFYVCWTCFKSNQILHAN